jgi:hypothetical protein
MAAYLTATTKLNANHEGQMAVLRSQGALHMVMAASASLHAEGEALAVHRNRDSPPSGQHFSDKSLVFSNTKYKNHI